ncbi:MAG TPA: CCA tRNA nucleotidyltransferase, partial [Kribbella sp.]|nr:CCA tRNA nucleotidyltransferase [Kribbella sp.]
MSSVQQRAVQALLELAPVVDELGSRFAAAGHEIALVGGPVRDILLGRGSKDLDFTTSAHPDVIERLLSGWADHVWDIGKAFGTIGSRKDDWVLEVTTYRSETYDPTSRKPEVSYGD